LKRNNERNPNKLGGDLRPKAGGQARVRRALCVKRDREIAACEKEAKVKKARGNGDRSKFYDSKALPAEDPSTKRSGTRETSKAHPAHLKKKSVVVVAGGGDDGRETVKTDVNGQASLSTL